MKQIENNAKDQIRFQFNAKLLSISEKVLQNSNGKNYKVATVEFEDVSGTIRQQSAAIYEGNYQYGVEVGKSYLCTATIVGDLAYLQMSHLLAGSGPAEASMFFKASAAETPVSVSVSQVNS